MGNIADLSNLAVQRTWDISRKEQQDTCERRAIFPFKHRIPASYVWNIDPCFKAEPVVCANVEPIGGSNLEPVSAAVKEYALADQRIRENGISGKNAEVYPRAIIQIALQGPPTSQARGRRAIRRAAPAFAQGAGGKDGLDFRR